MQPAIAYFCMEYGLDEDLPIYAGGLGILAGDHLKAAADLGLPLVGVGILWRQGYTVQVIGDNGWPYDSYPRNGNYGAEDTGIQVRVDIAGRPVAVRAWCVRRYGNAPLYLLDTDVPENDHDARAITSRLYQGTSQDRIAQEMVLGIGGVRVLRALGFSPAVYHFNEGHAVLAGTELIREAMAGGRTFAEAWTQVRQRIVFTTHTPVLAGNESHPLDLLEVMGAFNGLTRGQMAALGEDPFQMTVAGLRLARAANGVSALHGEVARNMWAGVSDIAPITHVTNGVHRRTWQDPVVAAAAQAGNLWDAHMANKGALIDAVAERTGARLSPQALLIGFARRATTYKRANLIFTRPERIEPLLASGQLQLLFAGKAHPKDQPGKGTVVRLVEMARRYPAAVVFVPNYDMHLGRLLTRGCDVWLNNPRRPLEASGTSGMKAAMNGVLNLSIPDGWWPEACRHGENGWAFAGDPGAADVDAADADALYHVLLGEVVPTYYDDRARWVQMMRSSIGSTQEAFSAARMVREYREGFYGI